MPLPITANTYTLQELQSTRASSKEHRDKRFYRLAASWQQLGIWLGNPKTCSDPEVIAYAEALTKFKTNEPPLWGIRKVFRTCWLLPTVNPPQWEQLPEVIRSTILRPYADPGVKFISGVLLHLPPKIATQWVQLEQSHRNAYIEAVRGSCFRTDKGRLSICGYTLGAARPDGINRAVDAVLTHGISKEWYVENYPTVRSILEEIIQRLQAQEEDCLEYLSPKEKAAESKYTNSAYGLKALTRFAQEIAHGYLKHQSVAKSRKQGP